MHIKRLRSIGICLFVFAVMVGLLFWLLGRLRVVELLVTGVAAAMLATAAAYCLFLRPWGSHDSKSRGS